MYSRLVIFVLLLSSTAYSKAPTPYVRWAFGLGASAVYQQPQYVDTDFSGIDDFSYQSKLQWLGEAKVRAYTHGIWVFGFSAGMRDAGWRKVNDHPEMEPHCTHIDYSFLYAFGDVSAGMNCFERVPMLYAYVGLTQQFNISKREKSFFQDGHTVSEDAFISPNKYPNSGYFALEYAWNVNAHSVIGFQYKFEVGIKKYHDVIIRGMQIQHGVGISYHFSL